MVHKKFLVSVGVSSETEIDAVHDMETWVKVKNEHGCTFNASELKFSVISDDMALLAEKAFDLAFVFPGNAELLEVIRKIRCSFICKLT